jgi:hypothetical protein
MYPLETLSEVDPPSLLRISIVPTLYSRTNIPARMSSPSNSPPANIKNFINFLFSANPKLLSLNTSSLLPGTLFNPSSPDQTDTESNIRNDTYLLTFDLISVSISGPLDGNTEGKREREYRRLSASSAGVRGVDDEEGREDV